MPSSETPLNKAHQHASNADDYINQGLLIPAAEEHYKSAEAFLQCVDQASDDGTKRTLRMLYNEHNKSGKELQRKIAKLKEEGKDPNIPQLSPVPFPGRAYPSPPRGAHSSSSSHAYPRGRMSDSNHTIDESYMVLGQQSDPADTFNQFWNVLEGMLDNLSQPVAFATAPLSRLGPTELAQDIHEKAEASLHERFTLREGSSSSDETDSRTVFVPKYNGRNHGLGQLGRERNLDISTASSKPVVNPLQEAMEATIIPNTRTLSDTSDLEEVFPDEDSPSGESFFMIPSTNDPSLEGKLQKENASLKSELTSLRRRFQTAERMRVEQEQQIRDGISQARREAQRVMSSSALPQRPAQPYVDLSALNLNVPPLSAFPPAANGGRDREAQLGRRVKELEEEVRTVRTENEKQKAMIIKFRERWEKLKESAKRKRSAKANGGTDNSVMEQRIDEEPEAEVAAKEEGLPKPLQTA